MGAIASLAGICLAILAMHPVAAAAGASTAPTEVPSIVVGSGRSELFEYDRDLKLVRRYVGFDKPVDVTTTADGTLLIVDEGWKKVVEMGRDGSFRWGASVGDYPYRARPRPGGGLLVSAYEKVVALDSERRTEFELPVRGLRAAVPLANGNVLVAYNDRQGWLAELTRAGAVVRRSAVAGYVDAAGKWVDEAPGKYFNSVYTLDVAPGGAIFAANFDGFDIRLLTPEMQLVASLPGFPHATDTRFGPGGELIAVSPEIFRIWVRWTNGRESHIDAPLEPRCANLTHWDTLIAGMWWNPENEVLFATRRRSLAVQPMPWWQRAVPLPALVGLLALVVAWLIRRRAATAGAVVADTQGQAGTSPPTTTQASPGKTRRVGGALAVIGCGVLAAAGLALAWSGRGLIFAGQRGTGFAYLALGGIVAAIALRFSNLMLSTAPLSTLWPATWPGLAARRDGGRTEILLGLAALALAGCMGVQLLPPEYQAVGVAAWVTAQIWVIAAALPPVRPAPSAQTAPRRVWPLVALLVAGALASRLWQIGYFPDNLHSDHNLYGTSVLELLRGNWRPFFILDPHTATYARPWIVPAAAVMALFGPGYEVLRLTAALSSALMVWGAYLLATELFNRRVGLIAAALVGVNHALLMYSRQPYVIESTAPFLLLLYCAFAGARRGCRLHWCLAGVIAGWAMLSPRQSTMFPFICAVIFLYIGLAYPRALWRQRGGLGWMIAGAAAAYLPMLPHMITNTALSSRLGTVTVFLNPDGSIRWDRELWQEQLLRSFGSLVFFHDSSAWGIGTWQPICLAIEACLLSVGLFYLLTSWRGPATFAVLATIVLSIFLGSALLTSPPTFYHYFIGMVAALFVCAVALDRIAALFDGWRASRALASLAIAAVVAAIGYEHLSITWRAVARPLDGPHEHLAAEPVVGAARFIRRNPTYRYYLVRSRRDHSSTSPEFFFSVADSDMSDISTDLRFNLPVPPVAGAPGAVFLVLPSRAADRGLIAETYPGAKIEEITCRSQTLWVYRVDAEELRSVAAKQTAAVH